MADDSDSSGLSEHSDKEIQKLAPIFIKAKKATKLAAPPPAVSPPRPKRPPSPPHEDVFADNPDIAFIVMFRSRFNDVLPSKLPHFGPQDVERGVNDGPPTQQVQQLLCAVLALVLNRKKPVERGHHGRALEEAVLSQKNQWPRRWDGQNPLHGGNTFENMKREQRLDLLRTLIMWSLTSSEAIQGMLKEKYKQQRHNDDENQPLSVQPWGLDGDKRRYFLIQGQDDTGFRIYRESHRYTKNATWYSMAGDIEDAKQLAEKLEKVDGTQAARRLAGRITNAIPTFEATEEKRRRREYRQIRRAAFDRPEPGFSLYEGRTRGKRMRYTYEEDDSFLSDDNASSARRSTRQSGRNTPMETGPTYTASGRQIRAPKTGEYGESLLSKEVNGTDELAPEYADGGMSGAVSWAGTEDSDPVRGGGRATRGAGRQAVNGAANSRKRKHIDGYNDIDSMSEEDEASAGEWDSDKNEAEDEDENMPDAEDEAEGEGEDSMDEDNESATEEQQSLVVKLKVPSKSPVPPELKNEDTSMVNGSASPAPRDDATGGASNGNGERAATNAGSHLSVQPGSSPVTGPSGYPTPTSSYVSKIGEGKSGGAPASAPAVQPVASDVMDVKMTEGEENKEHIAPTRELNGI